jgi:hypothetical protein
VSNNFNAAIVSEGGVVIDNRPGNIKDIFARKEYAPERIVSTVTDLSTGDKTFTLGKLNVRLHKNGGVCEVYAGTAEQSIVYWTMVQHYGTGSIQHQFGTIAAATAEAQLDSDVGYSTSANIWYAFIRINDEVWRIDVNEIGLADDTNSMKNIYFCMEKMKTTIPGVSI